MNFENYDVMMGINIRVGVYSWVYILNGNSSGHETWPTDKYGQERYVSATIPRCYKNVSLLAQVDSGIQLDSANKMLSFDVWSKWF